MTMLVRGPGFVADDVNMKATVDIRGWCCSGASLRLEPVTLIAENSRSIGGWQRVQLHLACRPRRRQRETQQGTLSLPCLL